MRAHSLLRQLLPQALFESMAARLWGVGRRPSAHREKLPDVQAGSLYSRAHPLSVSPAPLLERAQ